MPLKTKELYCGSRQHLHPDSHNDVQFCINRVQAGKNYPVPRVIPDCDRFSSVVPTNRGDRFLLSSLPSFKVAHSLRTWQENRSSPRSLSKSESSLAALEIRRCTDLGDGPHETDGDQPVPPIQCPFS